MTGDIKTVAFRVDASTDIGTGHFMRCLAVADALKRRGARVRFVSRHAPQHLRELVAASGHDFVAFRAARRSDSTDELPHSPWLGTSQRTDAQDAVEALSDQLWDWVVVDHYALDARWEFALRKTAKRLMAIDDLANRMHDCDVLIDQNLYEDMDRRYAGKVPAHCQLLLGPQYALLREEFRRLHQSVKPRNGQVKRVLVFFGGVDTRGHTAEAVAALATLGVQDLQVDVVIGPQYPRRQKIESACNEHGFACHVYTERMAQLMAAADLAIGAGGSASWERCCLGLPTLILCGANNQKQLIEDAALNGLVYAPAMHSGGAASLADHLRALLDNPALLRSMSRNGLKTVDGRGTERVLRSIGYGTVTVRRATVADSAKIFAWRNDPAARAASRDTNPIERSVHETWLAGVLADPQRLLLIGQQLGNDIGVVRFDVRNRAAEVSIYLAPELAENGKGAELLLAAEAWLIENRADVRTVEATVLRNNQRSRGLFDTCGYQLASTQHAKSLSPNE